MQTKLLIVDGVSTNRVALKVALATSWYQVETVSCAQDALALLDQGIPGLIIVNDTLPDASLLKFCHLVTEKTQEARPPILAISATRHLRAELLTAGAEDVLRSSDGVRHILAATRAVLRGRARDEEWQLRDMAPDHGPSNLMLNDAQTTPVLRISAIGASAPNAWIDHPKLEVQFANFGRAMPEITKETQSRVTVLEIPKGQERIVLELISNLRSNHDTRNTPILAITCEGQAEIAAQALDQGADDAVVEPVDAEEISVRIQRLHARFHHKSQQRASVLDTAESALRDPLTGLYNRRYAIPYLERIAAASEKSGRPFAVMIADLDHFKRVNDTFGHGAGDVVLKKVAKLLARNMGASDMVARLGGEEFLLVMPDMDRKGADQAARHLCTLLAQTPIRSMELVCPINVTLSIGLALSDSCPNVKAAQMPAALLDSADRALYRAKHAGRNGFMSAQTAA